MTERVRVLAEPAAEALGLFLYDLEVVQGRRLTIRLRAERRHKPTPTDGITIEECAALSRQVERLLDLEEVVPTRYSLEVSSPGLERRLKTRAHFAQAVGEMVRVVTRTPVDGRTVFEGTLVEVEKDERIVIAVAGSRVGIALSAVRRAHTVFLG